MEVRGKSYRTGMAGRIREIVSQINGPISRDEIVRRLDLWGLEKQKLNTCFLDMRMRGELVQIDDDKYHYNSLAAPKTDVRNRIYRAMHIKGAFCAADLVKLTEAEISYVRMIIRKLVKAGDLEFTGSRTRVKYYRVRNSDKFYQKFIKG